MPLCVCSEEIAKTVRFGREFRREEAVARANKILQRYDKDLVARWLWDKEKWSVWTKDRNGKEYLVVVVEGKNGEYREICQRDVEAIAKADLYRRDRTDTVLKEILENNKNLEEKQAKQRRDDVGAMCRERWRYTMSNPLVRVLTNLE